MDVTSWLFLAAYTCSGLAGLVYEVTWTRLLTLYLGHTTAAASAVVAAFLGGLAIEAGFGLTSLNWVGAVLAALGLGLAVLSGALDRGGSQSRGARSKSNSVGNVAQRAGACGSDHASLRN